MSDQAVRAAQEAVSRMEADFDAIIAAANGEDEAAVIEAVGGRMAELAKKMGMATGTETR